MSEIRHIYSK